MNLAIETKKLVKTYKGRGGSGITVVDNLDLEVGAGEIFGFLGPNGAGKTTTIKILLGIIAATSGEAYVLGGEAGDIEVHRRLSYLPEKPYYYEYMTGLELMRFYASLFKIKDEAKCIELLRRVNLGNDFNRPISQYSKGMQQRVGLAQSLLNDPELLFLDEPTGGLDPIAHIEIRDLILQFREEGKTVFISSHELSDVERICDRVAIINKGQIVAQGRLEHLLAGGRVEITADGVDQAMHDALMAPERVVSLKSGRLILDIADTDDVNSILDSLRTKQCKVQSIIPRRKRLEDLFIEAVGADDVAKGRERGRMTEKGEAVAVTETKEEENV
ncbi:MAG: ABC transporter ATP-binding protein [Fimbriimonadaceae bacterium]|nr:ABC transporter ATP-binding protein [Fimbriimonadaceae bacterium]